MDSTLEDPLDKAKALFQSHSEIDAAYLFGSAVKQSLARANDVDFGVSLRNKMEGELKAKLLLALIQKLEEIFRREADVVFMNDASPMMNYQILKEGKLVFERHPRLDEQIRLKAMNRYLDYLPLFQFFATHLRKKYGVTG